MRSGASDFRGQAGDSLARREALGFRGDVSRVPFPSQVTAHAATEEDKAEFAPYVREYCRLFGRDADAMLRDPYTVVTPDSKNPYKQMYVSD